MAGWLEEEEEATCMDSCWKPLLRSPGAAEAARWMLEMLGGADREHQWVEAGPNSPPMRRRAAR